MKNSLRSQAFRGVYSFHRTIRLTFMKSNERVEMPTKAKKQFVSLWFFDSFQQKCGYSTFAQPFKEQIQQWLNSWELMRIKTILFSVPNETQTQRDLSQHTIRLCLMDGWKWSSAKLLEWNWSHSENWMPLSCIRWWNRFELELNE